MSIKTAVNIIGAGLAGLSAALTLADMGIPVRLISVQASERAQSNLAEGGINAAIDVMGENDTVEEHARDTEKGGCYLADPNMIMNLAEAAPNVVRNLTHLGVPFHREGGRLIQRNFGGQKKKRTAYAKSSTGKVMTAALIDAVRRYEAAGLVTRLCHHRFEKLIIVNSACMGVQIWDIFQKKSVCYAGSVIMACGGFNGMFGEATTGTTANTGSAQAVLFTQGVRFANLEFLQYHPTTTAITGKRMLISEAARGEGGRLFCYADDGESKWYFMEEKYGERGNLMPRDVISREMAGLGRQVYLELAGLPENVWRLRLSDLREEIIHYLGIDPAKDPVPVSPGIHFCMGGIYVDEAHRTSIKDLYAAGECAAAYHGANRLGGNSLLGAIYGGRVAAESAARDIDVCQMNMRSAHESLSASGAEKSTMVHMQTVGTEKQKEAHLQAVEASYEASSYSVTGESERVLEDAMESALLDGMGILRDHDHLHKAQIVMEELMPKAVSDEMRARIIFAAAMLKAADERRESRGAHTRLDYPGTQDAFRKTTVVFYDESGINTAFEDIPERKERK